MKRCKCGETSPIDAKFCIGCGMEFPAVTGGTERLPEPSGSVWKPDYTMYVDTGNKVHTIGPFIPNVEDILDQAIFVDSSDMDILYRRWGTLAVALEGFNRACLYRGALYIER